MNKIENCELQNYTGGAECSGDALWGAGIGFEVGKYFGPWGALGGMIIGGIAGYALCSA